MKKFGMSHNGVTVFSTQENWSDTYLTDPALVRALGPFAVDVCCPPEMPWPTARRMMRLGLQDGLTDDWGRGRAWMNPPYRRVVRWAQRFLDHGDGIALLNGRSNETKASQLLLTNCAAVYFPAGRLCWYNADGTLKTMSDGSQAARWLGSVLVAMTPADAAKLERLPAHGFPGALLRGPRA